MNRYCLDTSAYSLFLKGEPQVRELISRADWIGMPSAALGELHFGFFNGSRAQSNEMILQDFLDQTVVHILKIGPSVARIFGELASDLRRAGTPLPINDVWIAAEAIRASASLITFDQHFRRIPRLSCVILIASPPT